MSDNDTKDTALPPAAEATEKSPALPADEQARLTDGIVAALKTV